MPTVSRDDRVRELRARIASGTYAVDAERIAEAMLRDGAVAAALGVRQPE